MTKGIRNERRHLTQYNLHKLKIHAQRTTTKPILQEHKQAKKIHIKHISMLACGEVVRSWGMRMENGDKREFLKTCLPGQASYLIGFGGRII